MIKKLYSIRDNATKFYDVITDDNDRASTRSFSHAINNPASLMFANPDDFALYCVGTFNTETGEITSELPTIICYGNQVKISEVDNHAN